MLVEGAGLVVEVLGAAGTLWVALGLGDGEEVVPVGAVVVVPASAAAPASRSAAAAATRI